MVRLRVDQKPTSNKVAMSFNSSMVRLRVVFLPVSTIQNFRFNSSMVRLRDLKYFDPGQPIVMFQFQYGAIKSVSNAFKFEPTE